MSSPIEQIQSHSLVDRAKNILLKPGTEWDRIALEPTSVNALFKSYAMILAAIGPVCGAVGAIVFGYGAFGITIRPPILSVLVGAVVSYILALASVFVLGLIIEALAPNFGGTKDRTAAMKVAVYASTASWIAGVFGILPALAPLAILGIYSLYLVYLGLPKLMAVPQEKALPYTGVIIVVAVVLGIVIAAVITPLRMIGAGGGAGLFGAAAASHGSLNGQMKIGDATVDLGKLEAASKQMQAQAAAMQASVAAQQAGTAAPAAAAAGGIAPDVLKGLLPTGLSGFARGDVSAETAGAAGLGVSTAKADYSRGDARITLEITDMAAMGGLAGLAGAMGVNSSKETADGYEKVSTVGGRMTTEEYNRSSKHGKYAVLAGGRVMVQAEGDNVSIDDLKAAVNAVGPERVEALARKG